MIIYYFLINLFNFDIIDVSCLESVIQVWENIKSTETIED